MNKKLLSEITRVKEMMGILNEQDVNPKEIRTIDGKRYEVSSTVLPPYQSGKWSATFKPGKYKGGDMTGNIDGDIAKLAKYLNQPDLVNQKVFVAITAGSSKSPINPKGNLATILKGEGVEPTNAGLAELRGRTALNLVKSGLKGQIPYNLFNNIEFVVDLSQIEQGPDFVVGTDNANDPKYTPYQFLSATASAQATQETLAELPEICNTNIKGSGGRGKRGSKGPTGLPYAAYPENDGLGQKIDLGVNTEGEITFNFTALKIPDMFQITYGENVYTSSGPGGEGFVSNRFKTCEEGSKCYKNFTKRIQRLEDSIGDMGERLDKKKSITRGLPSSYVGMLEFTNGVDVPEDRRVDMEWITNFFEKFTPAKKNFIKKLFTKKKRFKFNSDFKDGYRYYNEDGTPRDRRPGEVKAKDVWKRINDIWIELSDSYEDYADDKGGKISAKEKEIETLKAELKQLMETGNPDDYAKAMTRKLLGLGFPAGVIGTNGSITFDKVKGVGDMYLQVYAPLDGTVWRAEVACKDLQSPVAQN